VARLPTDRSRGDVHLRVQSVLEKELAHFD